MRLHVGPVGTTTSGETGKISPMGGIAVVLQAGQANSLARALRDLRKSRWPGVTLTQEQLATAFSREKQVRAATISSWESTVKPTRERLNAYARFFSTRRSLEGGPRLLPETELSADEKAEFRALEARLLGLLRGDDDERDEVITPLAFDDGPVIVICPEAPLAAQGALARERDPNFTKLQQYADLDALLEIYGHLRASNSVLDVFYRLAREVKSEELSSHLILLGGVGWNQVTERIQDEIGKVLPVTQIEVEDVPTGEIFEVETGAEPKRFYPTWKEHSDGQERELTEDVAFIARLPNPFKIDRTLMICNGVHSRGVVGAVRCLTDSRVRDANERYLAERFPRASRSCSRCP